MENTLDTAVTTTAVTTTAITTVAAAISAARNEISACQGTALQEIAERQGERLDTALAVGLIHPARAGRPFDWSIMCPGCGAPVVGFGQSPTAECPGCNGTVSQLYELALLHKRL